MITSNIKKIMEEKKITVRALTEMSRLSQGSILRARSDELIGRCSLETLEAIADVLGVKISDLYNQIPNVKENTFSEHIDRTTDFNIMERAMKHFQEEQEERIRNLMEESITKHVREFERKLRENQQEVLKKAGLPPIDSIF